MSPSPAADHPGPASDGLARLTEIDLASEPIFLMARAAALGSSTANQGLAPLGLKVRSYSLLAAACSGTGPTQRELGELLRMKPSQTVALLDELEQRGLVERQADPGIAAPRSWPPPVRGGSSTRAPRRRWTSPPRGRWDLRPQDREDLARLLRQVAF